MQTILICATVGLGLYFFNWVWTEWGKLIKVTPKNDSQAWESDEDIYNNLNY
jgi:hypothetical protein